MTVTPSETTKWWGTFSFGAGEGGFWQIGPLSLRIERFQREWRIERRSDAQLSESECRVELPSDESVEGDDVAVSRYSFGQTTQTLRLTPRLADRAVVVYPESPFFVTAGQEIVLFCSTPLWVQVEVGEEKTILEEFPTVRPSDTWFGSSTREGELCYATTTAARLRREDLLPRPHRAVTELRICNEASDTLQIEKVNLTVPFLSLHAAADGRLWTDRVTLHRTPDGSQDELEIVQGAPDELRATTVSAARVATDQQSVMVRAFHALFR